MPGAFGGFLAEPNCGVAARAKAMLVALNAGNRYRCDLHVEPDLGAWLGRTNLGILNREPQPVFDFEGRCRLVFHGEIHNNSSGKPDAVFALDLYRRDGDMFAASLRGIFHIVVQDTGSHTVKLFSDKFGLQPLYYLVRQDGILFAAEVRGLLASQDVDREPDYRSIGDFFRYGQILGCKTLFRDVSLLPPGSILSYDMVSRHVSLRSYWRLLDLFPFRGRPVEKASENAAVESLAQAVSVRSVHQGGLGLSLSGGLDSRALLAALGPRAHRVHTYTLGLPGCADERIGQSLAKLAGTQHAFVPIEREHLENFEGLASTMVSLSEGQYHPHESTEGVALKYLADSPFEVLLRGHGGELAKASLAYPVAVRPEANACRSSAEALDYIYRTTNIVLRDIEPRELFSAAVRETLAEGPRMSLAESCGEAAQVLMPGDLCIFYYATEHVRRQVVASLEIFRSCVEVRLPYLDEEFLAILLKLPIEHRSHGEIQRRLVARFMPRAVKVVNSNTGAPLDAGPLRVFLTEGATSLLKRLSLPGYRHYTEFQEWHRTVFRDGIHRVLFSERALERGLYDPRQLRMVFEAHITRQRDYAHLLGTAVGIELWFREFVD